MKDSKNGAGLYVGMVVVQSILYGLMDIVSKQVYNVILMPVWSFLLLRYAAATAVMFLIFHKIILRELRTVPVKTYIVPGLCMATAFIFSGLALQYTTATNMSFVRSLSALLVPLLGLVFYRQKYTKAELILQPFVLLGLYLLCARGNLTGFGIGEIMAFIAALLVAGSLVFGKSALEHISVQSLSFVQCALAVVVCFVMTLMTGTMESVSLAADGRVIAAIAFAALGCTIGGYLLQNIALTHISAKLVGIVQCLYPIATAVLAYVILHETLTITGLVGAAILLVCVVLENIVVKDKT